MYYNTVSENAQVKIAKILVTSPRAGGGITSKHVVERGTQHSKLGEHPVPPITFRGASFFNDLLENQAGLARRACAAGEAAPTAHEG